jgi:hypothetical protein
MATSPLNTALKPNVSAGNDAEQKYQEALSQLMERLDTRRNRLLDPTMLAMAQGFLTPGQTGSFGEALGNAARNVGAAQQQQQKEDVDIAQMRLQVAQGARDQASKIKGQQAFQGLLGGPAPTAGAAPAAAAGTPGPTEGAAPGAAPTAGRAIRMEDALAFAAAYPDQKDLAKMLADAAKFASDRYKIAMNGTVFDSVSGNYVAQIPPGQTASEYFVPEARGTVSMTPGQYSAYQDAKSKGEGKKWLDKFFEAEPGKPGEYLTKERLTQQAEERKQTPSKFVIPELGGEMSMTPGQYQQYLDARNKGTVKEWLQNFRSPAPEGVTGRPLTSAALEAEAAGQKVEEESVRKANAERYNNAISKGDDAGSRIALFKRIVATAEQKDADKILGVFETGKFGDALLQYMEANNGALGVKNIRDIWTNLGLDPKLIADKQVLLSLIAQSQFDFRALAKGQGAISDMETKLFNSMGADISDRPEAVIRKMKMLERRAEFDREVSRMARESRKKGVSYDDMKDTDGYRRASELYMSDLMKYVTGSGRNAPPAARAPAQAPAQQQRAPGRTSPAGDALRRDLGF